MQILIKIGKKIDNLVNLGIDGGIILKQVVTK